jgi:predicted nucleic acid-binding protein
VQVAIDSSVLVGLLNPDDLWHAPALGLRDALLDAGMTVVYFDCVIAEAISTAARRLHEKGRRTEVQELLKQLESHTPHDLITWVLPDAPRLYHEVLELIRTSTGELNFNDALIALACRERGISALASFDPDFDQVSWLKRIDTPTDVATPS